MAAKALPVRIAPSILSADFARLAEEVERMQEAGADWIHVDVMDGRFVGNLTVGPPVVKALRAVTRLPLDVHIMIAEPDRYVPAFCEAGADFLTFHCEAAPDPAATCEAIRRAGAKPGISVRPRTPLFGLDDAVAAADLVLVMTVEPGFGGQAFMPDQVPKIADAFAYAGGRAHIEVDGGITHETVRPCARAGANVIVSGSYIFGHRDPAEAIRKLRDGAMRGHRERTASLYHSVDED